MTRYLGSLGGSLVLTDYLEFRWYVDGERRLSARLGIADKGKMKPDKAGATDGKLRLLKLGTNGETQWLSSLIDGGGPRGSPLSVEQTSDGVYVAAGSYLVPRYSSQGSLSWQYAYEDGDSPWPHITSIRETTDGFVLTGIALTYTGDRYQMIAPWIMKLDTDGSVVWANQYRSEGHSWGCRRCRPAGCTVRVIVTCAEQSVAQ